MYNIESNPYLMSNSSDSTLVAAAAAAVGTAVGIVVQKLLDAFTLRMQHRQGLERHFLELRYDAARKAARLLMSAAKELSAAGKALKTASSGTASSGTVLAVEQVALTDAQMAQLANELSDAYADLYLLLDEAALGALPSQGGKVDIFRSVAESRASLRLLRETDEKIQKMRNDKAITDNAEHAKAMDEILRTRQEITADCLELCKVVDDFADRVRRTLRALHRTFERYE